MRRFMPSALSSPGNLSTMKNTLVTPTRERVLGFIKQEGKASVKALTEEIGITPMAIRGHLNKLEKEELIKVTTLRQKLGRPLQVFSLTEKGETCFPQDYGRFAVEILHDLRELDGGKTLELVIKKREERIVAGLRAKMAGAQDWEEKMQIYHQFAEFHGNMPTLEKQGPRQFVLYINNCSLKAVVDQFPSCCDSEVSILHRLFPEAKVNKTKSLRNNDKSCCYQFSFP